jgi:hypothetical protein
MADQQGTGKHPHKSAAEPFEHHEAPTSKAGSHSGGEQASSKSASSSQSGEQGTGKHPHKSSSDPKEHHEGAKASK